MNSLEDIRKHFKQQQTINEDDNTVIDTEYIIKVDSNNIPPQLLNHFTSFFLLGILTLILFVIIFALGIGRNLGFFLTAAFLIIAFIGYGFINLYNVLKYGYKMFEGICVAKNFSVTNKKTPKSFVIKANELMIEIPLVKKNIELPTNAVVKVYAPAKASLTSFDETTLKLSSIYTYEMISILDN